MEEYQEYWDIPSKQKYHYDDGTLKLNDEIVSKYDNKYFKKYTVTGVQGTWEDEVYTQYEMLLIDIQGYIESGDKNDDMEMLCALYWSWGIQMSQQDGIQLVDYSLSNNEDGWMKIVDKTSSGVPLIVSYQSSAGGHSINAMRILRDIENPNVFYLECYDNNDRTNPYYFKIVTKNMNLWDGTSIENWGKNYMVNSYMKVGDEWKSVGLEMQDVIIP